MKKSPDLNETISKGAAEVVEVLENVAGLIDAEWQRLITSIEDSDAVPDQVKQAIGQAVEQIETVGPALVDTGRRAAEQLGIDLSDLCRSDTADTGAKREAAEVSSRLKTVVAPSSEPAAKGPSDVVAEKVTGKAKTATETATKTKAGAKSKTKSKTSAKSKTKSTAKKSTAKAKSGTTAKAKKPKAKTSTAKKSAAKKSTAKAKKS